MLEAARDTLPLHTHIASLFELTLDRLRQEATAMRRVEPPSAASGTADFIIAGSAVIAA